MKEADQCNAVGARLMLALALMLITWQSLTPQPVALPPGDYDKLAHGLGFLLLALLTDAAWPQRGFGALKWLPLFAYGGLIELLQQQIPNRSASLWDLAADAAGLALYPLLLMPLLRRLGWR